MKKLLFVLLLLAKAQNSYPQTFSIGIQNYDVISKYDTTVLNAGDNKCIHDFVFKKEPMSYSSCAVMHGPEGCSANWMDEKCICTICLRHLRIVETRSIKQKPDAYTVALNRLNSKN